MNRIPIADWAAQAPWGGISGKPKWVGNNGPLVDLAGVTWQGVTSGRYPIWNGTRFVPSTISGGPGGGGTIITDGILPGVAVRRRPPGNPSGEYENVWDRFVFNVRLYGAIGGGVDDLPAINAAIFDLNQAGMGVLYFPAGAYRCSAQPDRLSGFCLVKGDGIGVTTLTFNRFNGFSFDAGTTAGWFGVEQLAIEQVGTAIIARGGGLDINSLGIDCGACGIAVFAGRPGSPPSAGRIEGCYFTADGTSSTAMRLSGGLEVVGVQVLGSGDRWDHGLVFDSGTSADIHDSYFSNITNEAVFLGTAVTSSRVHDIAFGDILSAEAIVDHGSGNYVNEFFGIGGNIDTRFEHRKELYSIFAWNPGTMAPGSGWYDDFNVPGAAFGDQCVLGIPYTFYEGIMTDIRVTAADTVRVTLTNVGTAGVDLASGSWKVRLFN